jgi:hypothetical protein
MLVIANWFRNIMPKELGAADGAYNAGREAGSVKGLDAYVCCSKLGGQPHDGLLPLLLCCACTNMYLLVG